MSERVPGTDRSGKPPAPPGSPLLQAVRPRRVCHPGTEKPPTRLARSWLLVTAAALIGCGVGQEGATVELWALGREGEVVQQLVPEFERANPGLRVRVQQIPWSAAHEKLLTAFAADALPDVLKLGNTWIPEFVALRALLPLGERIARSDCVESDDYFPEILETNVVRGTPYGVPWYVDTRVAHRRY